MARPGGPPTDTGWWPRPPGQQQLITDHGHAKLRISTNHLMFARTPLGTPRSLSIQLTNLSQEIIKWNIFGYSMPYLITVSVGGGRAGTMVVWVVDGAGVRALELWC